MRKQSAKVPKAKEAKSYSQAGMHAYFSAFAVPVVCPICSNPLLDGHVCGVCLHCDADMPLHGDGFVCQKCGRALLSDSPFCDNCKQDQPLFTKACSPFSFADPIRRPLHLFKYREAPYLADYFATHMLHTIKSKLSGIHFDYIVFVPMPRWRKFSRGYNQAELLAVALSRLMHLPVYGCLYRKHTSKSQVTLDAKGRHDNAFKTIRLCDNVNIADKVVLLVDDTMTSSSTLSACAHQLLRGKAKDVFAVTVASVDEKLPNITRESETHINNLQTS